MPLDHTPYRTLLFQALAADYGLIVESNNPDLLYSRLSVARRTDPMLKDIKFLRTKIDPTWIYLVKVECYEGKGESDEQ